jgi:hypothetical protein
VSVLSDLAHLRSLNINTKLPWSDFRQAPALEQVEALWFGAGMNQRISLRGIERWVNLQRVRLMGPWEAAEVAYLHPLESLEELEINLHAVETLGGLTFPQLKMLDLRCPQRVSVAPILKSFPGLRKLTLNNLRGDGVVDLRDVQFRGGLRIQLRGFRERLNVQDGVSGMLRMSGTPF